MLTHVPVIYATGFDVSFRPRYPIVGLNNIDLREQWKEDPEAYLSVSVPSMPKDRKSVV